MTKDAIQFTPTGDLLDTRGYLTPPEVDVDVDRDLMMFDTQEDAEEYMRDALFGTNGQGLEHEVITYQG